MGATNFSNQVVIKGTARDAFREANEEANDYNGHQDGYSGDIQTANGFRMRSEHPRYGTAAFDKWENKLLDDMDKGECICVEILGAPLKRIKGARWKGKRGVKGYYFFGMARC
tara:strand:- start:218 stop:556 length:339 start_codon:yes stop_codon:yes gene_type:complete